MRTWRTEPRLFTTYSLCSKSPGIVEIKSQKRGCSISPSTPNPPTRAPEARSPFPHFFLPGAVLASNPAIATHERLYSVINIISHAFSLTKIIPALLGELRCRNECMFCQNCAPGVGGGGVTSSVIQGSIISFNMQSLCGS